MTLIKTYQNNTHHLMDASQLQVLEKLEAMRQAIILETKRRNRLLKLRLLKTIPGLYLWGGVGIGKTFLLDIFFENLPIKEKQRMHFFNFMQFIHSELKKHAGKKNPLQIIGKTFAKKDYVLCLDEFFVDDIVNAMLLGRLLSVLFKEGVCILATSNVEPDLLYKRGLQREQFLPAIAAIKKHMVVWHLETKIDYRKLKAEQLNIFEAQLHQRELELEDFFNTLTENQPIETHPIVMADHLIQVRKRTTNVIWFDFDNICRAPRAHADFLKIAENYKCVFLSNIPMILAEEKNTIRLFISLIDVLYDAKTKLFFSSHAPIEDIYTTGDMIFEFARTASRLIEFRKDDKKMLSSLR